jgi:hypothetical protein
MPTAFTRAAGTAALASALAWVLAAAALSVNGLRGGDDGLYILFAIPAMLAAVTTAVALAGGRRDGAPGRCRHLWRLSQRPGGGLPGGGDEFALGLVPLGRWLRSEQVVMVGDSVPCL